MLLLAPDDWTDTWLARSLSRDSLTRCWGRGSGRLEQAGLRSTPALKVIVNALTHSRTERTEAAIFGRYDAQSVQLAKAFRKIGSALIWLDTPTLAHVGERETRQFRQLADRLILSDATASTRWRELGFDACVVSCPLSCDLDPRDIARETLDLTPRARSIAIVLTDRALEKALVPALSAFATLLEQFASIDARVIVRSAHAPAVRAILEARPFGGSPQMIHLDLVGKNRSQFSAFDIVWSDDRFTCLVAAACGVPSVYVASRGDTLLSRSDARWWWQALSASIMHAESWQTTSLVEQSELLIESAPSRRRGQQSPYGGGSDLARILAPWVTPTVSESPRQAR